LCVRQPDKFADFYGDSDAYAFVYALTDLHEDHGSFTDVYKDRNADIYKDRNADVYENFDARSDFDIYPHANLGWKLHIQYR